MSKPEYYIHNLSPFIFRVSELNLAWTKTALGISFLVLIITALLLFISIVIKRLDPESRSYLALNLLRLILFFLSIGFLIIVGVNYANLDWGLRWYSAMYLLGFIYCYLCCRYWIANHKMMLTQIQLDSLIAFLILGMIAGARIAYVFLYNWEAYSNNPSDIIKVWEGGLSFHGGIIGVVSAIIIFCRIHKIPFFHLADKLSYTVPLGIFLGRIGNFMNGELYGRIIEQPVPWAVIFSNSGGGPQPRHPSQIYQSIGEGLLLWGVLFLISRRKNHEGTLSAAFIFFYGFFRFFVEYFREPDDQLKFYLNNTTTMGQILCLLTMFIGATIFILTRKNIVEGTPEWKVRTESYQTLQKELEN